MNKTVTYADFLLEVTVIGAACCSQSIPIHLEPGKGHVP